MTPMIMKTIISVPSDHDDITGGELEREREEKSVKCLESWIRYIWLQNILRHETTVPGPGEGEERLE